jgi:hypothetical protein
MMEDKLAHQKVIEAVGARAPWSALPTQHANG